jgi:hypothetical protein
MVLFLLIILGTPLFSLFDGVTVTCVLTLSLLYFVYFGLTCCIDLALPLPPQIVLCIFELFLFEALTGTLLSPMHNGIILTVGRHSYKHYMELHFPQHRENNSFYIRNTDH